MFSQLTRASFETQTDVRQTDNGPRCRGRAINTFTTAIIQRQMRCMTVECRLAHYLDANYILLPPALARASGVWCERTLISVPFVLRVRNPARWETFWPSFPTMGGLRSRRSDSPNPDPSDHARLRSSRQLGECISRSFPYCSTVSWYTAYTVDYLKLPNLLHTMDRTLRWYIVFQNQYYYSHGLQRIRFDLTQRNAVPLTIREQLHSLNRLTTLYKDIL